ncbi:carboxypeptidase-like regulatory domain-containing protein, partial [Calditrichota bacterium]
GYSIVQTPDSGFALGGSLDGYDTGWGLAPNSGMIKVDKNGSEQWSHVFEIEATQRCTELIPNTNGGYVLVGGEDGGTLGRLDEERRNPWLYNWGYAGLPENFRSGVQTRDGGFAMGGYALDYGSECYGWLVVVDEDYQEIIDTRYYYGYNTNEGFYDIVERNDAHGLSMAGWRGGDMMLMVVDEEYDEEWSEEYGEEDKNEWCYSFIQLGDGGYLLAGHESYLEDDEEYQYNIWLVRTDDEGEVVWSEVYGAEGREKSYSIIQTIDGGFAVAGYTNFEGAGDRDYWLVRLSPESPTLLEGYVYDMSDSSGVLNAKVKTSKYRNAVTDSTGYWRMDYAPYGEIDFTVIAPGFNDLAQGGYEIELEDTLRVDFYLANPEIDVSVDLLAVEIEPGDSTTSGIQISNPGLGVLEWSLELLPEEGISAEPWDSLVSMNMVEIIDDTQLEGVVFADGDYYISGRNRDGDSHLIYIVNIDGELTGSFAQPDPDDRYGMHDLAWDPGTRTLWGAVGQTVYGFGTDGEIRTSFDVEIEGTGIQSVAWDSDRGVIWVSELTSDLFAYTPQGELVQTLERGDFFMVGLCYNFRRGTNFHVNIDITA